MKKFVITTESNSDLDPQYISANEIGVIPHYYTVEENVYGDGNELTIREFYDAMRAGKKVATMASNPAVILERFEAYAQSGCDILHISFSSALSGGYNNIVVGAQETMESYPDTKIIVIDTLSASLAEGILIMKAVEMRNAGKGIEEAAKTLTEMIPHLCAFFTVDDLNHLYRGGRLSKSAAVLGTMINIKPILFIDEEGKLVPLDKVRGRKKSLATLIDNMESRLGSYRNKQVIIGILHGDCEEDADYLSAAIQEKFGYKNICIRPIGPSIGAHSGPGAIAIVFLGENR